MTADEQFGIETALFHTDMNLAMLSAHARGNIVYLCAREGDVDRMNDCAAHKYMGGELNGVAVIRFGLYVYRSTSAMHFGV